MTEAAQQQTPKKPEGLGKYLAIASVGCLFLLAIAGAIIYFVFRLTAGPVEVVNEQLKALKEGDLEKGYSYCSAAFKQNTNYEQFQQFVSSFPVLKNAKGFSSPNRQFSGNQATVKGTINGEDGSAFPAVYQLVKESGEWKIQYIDFSSAGAPSTGGITQQREASRVATPPTAPAPDTPSPMTAPEQMQIGEVNIDKQTSGNVATVKLAFRVTKFVNDKSGGSAKIHLVQDLQTFDPAGNMIRELSADGIKEVQESGNYPQYDYVDFSNTLTIPNSYPSGTYTAKIIVHDRIGDTSIEALRTFEIP